MAGAPGSLAELLARIAADPALSALLADARARDAAPAPAPPAPAMAAHGAAPPAPAAPADPAHDAAHALRVALWPLRLGGSTVNAREAIAAALLHDAVAARKDSPERAGASERAAALAAARLPALGFGPEAVARIAAAVRDHSFRRGAVPAEPLGRALQDADRLEALGAIGLARCLATGAGLGGAPFDPADPWAETRPLDDARWSVDHFFTKLLRLPATFHTAAGREEAERRAAFLRAYLARLGEELERPWLGDERPSAGA